MQDLKRPWERIKRRAAEIALAATTAELNLSPAELAAMHLLLATDPAATSVLGLTWEQVDLEGRNLRIGNRAVYFSAEAAAALGALPEAGNRPGVSAGLGLAIDSLDRTFHDLRNRLGIRDLRLHDLPHSAAQTRCPRSLK